MLAFLAQLASMGLCVEQSDTKVYHQYKTEGEGKVFLGKLSQA